MAVTHGFVNPKADGGDTTIVRPSDWNGPHIISGTLAWDGATVTADTPLLDLTQTWNSAAVTFTGFKLNVTNTAAAVGSTLLDLQRGGTSVFKIGSSANTSGAGAVSDGDFIKWTNNGGTVTISNTANYNGVSFSLIGGGAPTWTFSGGSHFYIINGAYQHVFNGPNFGLPGTTSGANAPEASAITFSDYSNTTDLGTSVSLRKDGTQVLGIFRQSTPTSPCGLRVYNTYTDVSNFERGVFDWTTTANRLTIGTQEAGSGSPRAIDIKAVDGAGPNGYNSTYGLILSSGAGGSDYLGINAGAGVDISASVSGLMGGLHARFAGGQVMVGANPIQFGIAVGLVDTGIRRNAPDVIAIDNGTAGSYRDLKVRDIIHIPSSSLTPANNGELVIQATSNTSLTFKYKGSDGTVRSASLTLA